MKSAGVISSWSWDVRNTVS